jgi:5-methylcytosine-specific restriction protein A
MSRREFSKAVKRQAFDRAGEQCEGCSAPLTKGKFHYDHDIPDALGGEPELWNCKVLCVACHAVKTGKKDVPAIAKTKRIQDREKGIRKPRSITRWRKFDRSIVRAARER